MVKKAKTVNGLAAQKSTTEKSARHRRLMAGANISDYRVTQILECYAGQMKVAQASAVLDISHVTVGRIFNLIRTRLVAVKVYPTARSVKNALVDFENDGGTYYDGVAFDAELQALVDLKRGVSDGNRHLYEAEFLFRREHEALTAGQFLLILKAVIKETGPLDRPPRRPVSMTALQLLLDMHVVPETLGALRGQVETARVSGGYEAGERRHAEMAPLRQALRDFSAGIPELRELHIAATRNGHAIPNPGHLPWTPPPFPPPEDGVDGRGDEKYPRAELRIDGRLFTLHETTAFLQVVVEALRKERRNLIASFKGTPRERFEIELMDLRMEFCGHFIRDPYIMGTPAGNVVAARYDYWERDLARHYGIVGHMPQSVFASPQER